MVPSLSVIEAFKYEGWYQQSKYYICQIDLLMEAGLDKVLKKWSATSFRADKIWSASMRRLDKNYKEGNPKTEGLDDESDFGNGVFICL